MGEDARRSHRSPDGADVERAVSGREGGPAVLRRPARTARELGPDGV